MALISDIDAAFLDHLAVLQDTAANNADSVCSNAQRIWYVPDVNSWAGDPLDITGMNTAFDRTDLNTDYTTIAADSERRGTVGEVMAVKTQIDYLAALERAYRTQQCTSVRARIHASARRHAHGKSGGLFDGSSGQIALWLARILAAAQYDPEDV